MKITKSGIDAGLTIVAAVTAPVLTTLVDAHTLSAMVATDLGSIVAAVVTAWHGGAAVQRRATTDADPVAVADALAHNHPVAAPSPVVDGMVP
jgi:hypothetical protein